MIPLQTLVTTHKTRRIITQAAKMRPKIPPTAVSLSMPAPRASGPGNRRHGRDARTAGFTLIEILVVIGIILILIGLFIAGVKVVTAQAKVRDTKSMLETCKTMFENYRQATHLSRPPTTNTIYGSAITNNPLATPSATGFWLTGIESAPTSTSPDVLHITDSIIGNRPYVGNLVQLPPAVYNTELVLQTLISVPGNQAIFNNLPPSKVVKDAVTGYPLLLDGWGDVILFVPGGGLGEPDLKDTYKRGFVWLDGATYGVITTAGTITPNTTPYNTANYDPASFPAGTVNLQNQPFFASAGPDGDASNAHNYTTGNPTSDMSDDNIYSFK
jgi:prepilin-type N-terminal cleavage/methylation domain-containing protein